MNAMNRIARLAAATGCLLWIGAAVAQGPTSGLAGGTSDGYASVPDKDDTASRGNTPTTAGGPTSQTSRSAGDAASTTSGSKTGDASSKTTAMTEGISGTITRVDGDRKVIELQGDRKIQVDPSTEIRRNGEKASFKDLHAGDDVRASFQGADQTMVKRIDVMPNDGTSGAGSSTSGSSSPSTPPSSSSTGR